MSIVQELHRSFICTYDDCNKSYSRLAHLRRHEDVHENSYKCTENNCGQIFKSKFTLKKHIDNIHRKKTAKKYKCSICDQEFNKHNWLLRHQYKHTGVRPYVCPKEGCEKRFLVPSKLKRHMKVHEGYTCSKDNCGLKFPKWTLYLKHVAASHPKIHKCQKCEKEFSTSHNLKAHLEVHKFEDREVYLCPKPNCSRFYFMKRNLTHHLKSYHEKRPFVCTEGHCYKAFKSEEDLNTHASRHDPKKRARKKKKSNPRPTFIEKLVGLVPRRNWPPRKIIDSESSDEASEVYLSTSEEEIENVSHTSHGENNEDICSSTAKEEIHVSHTSHGEDNRDVCSSTTEQEIHVSRTSHGEDNRDVCSSIAEEEIDIPHTSHGEDNRDVCSSTAEEEKDASHTFPGENNQDVPIIISASYNIPVYNMDGEIQTVLNIKEIVLERESFCSESPLEYVSA